MRLWKCILPVLASTLCFAVQPDRISGALSSSQVTRLSGNVHGLAKTEFDQGRTDSSMILQGVSLTFKPSATQQTALNTLLAQQRDPSSPNYHKWLTPSQFADRFGLSQGDVDKIVAWFQAQGLTVTRVANSRNQIVVEGTVAQIEAAFHTEIHNYLIDGEVHFANSTEPSVPAALSGIALGVQHLHNFQPRARAKFHTVTADPRFTSVVSGNHFVAPGDFATIYNVTPLYTGGTDGTGQGIAVVGQSSIALTDVANFRSAAGLAAKAPTLLLEPGTGTSTRCGGDEGESDLDVEWSGAVAKNASITFVYAGLVAGDSCTNRQFGAFDALQYAIDNNLAPVISNSYGNCEANVGQAFALTMQGWIQQANSQGQTVMSASGDSGAADCDFQVMSATQGLAVDIPAAIPEVTGMGGTEFTGDADACPGGTCTGNAPADLPYWSGTTGGVDAISSALEYIPEMGWNDTVENLNATPPGTIAASGGGASIYFAKPTWQTGTGVPADAKRDVPDMAMNASADHDGYLFCSEDGGNSIVASCTDGFRTGAGGSLTVVGGTSVAAPTFSGIVALLNEYLITNGFQTASGIGNANPNLYYIAANNPSAMHDVTSGTNVVPCTQGSLNCPTSAPFQFGFDAGAGYDEVTGLGSVNANSLAVAWGDLFTSTTTSVSASPNSVNEGATVTFTATVAPSTATGTVSFFNNGSTTALGTATLSSGTAVFSTTALPAGTDSVTATYNGINAPSTSAATTVNVIAPDFTLQTTSPLAPASVPAGQSAMATLTIAPVTGSATITFTPSSCSGLPTGAMCSFNPSMVTFGGVGGTATTVLTVSTLANMTLPTGSQTITVTGTVSGGNSHTTTVSLAITATNQAFTLTAPTTNFSFAPGGTASVTINVNGTGSPIAFSPASLPLTFTCTGLPSESTGTFSPGTGTCSGGSSISVTTGITLNIATTAPTAKLQLPPGHSNRIFYALLLPGVFGIVLAAGGRPRGARMLGLVLVLGLSTMWLGSCGGSSSSQKNPGTTPGTYSVVVTAATPGPVALTSATPALTITLTIQ